MSCGRPNPFATSDALSQRTQVEELPSDRFFLNALVEGVGSCTRSSSAPLVAAKKRTGPEPVGI